MYMGKMKSKSMLSLLVSLAMVFSMMPSEAFAASQGKQKESVVMQEDGASNITQKKATDVSVNTSGGAVADYVITEEELTEAGVDWKDASKCTIYVKIKSGSSMSVLQATGEYGEDVELTDGKIAPLGKTSSKYLAGKDNTLGKSGNFIQDNIVGAAGSGIYKFPEVNLNTTVKTNAVSGTAWSDEQKDYITLKVLHWTDDIEYELLGIAFNNSATYPADFTVPNNVESATLDVAGESPKNLLKLSLDYIDKMDGTKYQPASWEAFKQNIADAKAVYDKSDASEEELKAARETLEAAKAKLLFVDSTAAAKPMPFRQLTNEQVLQEMGVGINLGNTLDGHSSFTPSETAWQSTKTTKKIIKSMHDAGFNTVRIPVTWGNMIDEENGYQLNPNWISRVQEIVDYCVSQDMYAIINIHHDGAEQTGWLKVAADDIDVVYEEFECVWRNIAEYFKDYDEHLIFESMNEITCMEGDLKNSAEAVNQDTPVIVNLNQIFVNVVRSTGSNNKHRWLASVAHYANSGNHEKFVLPEDSYNQQNALMFAAHIYKHSTNTTWTYDQIYEVVDGLKRMADKFDVPMYLGEYGTRTYEQEGTASGYNDVARAYFSEIVHRACKKAGCIPVVWDQGAGNKGEKETGLYHFWDRTTCTSLFKTITDAMMRGSFAALSEANQNWDFSDVQEGVAVTAMTDIVPSEASVSLLPGERKQLSVQTAPAGSNDVVLWSTDDDNVATVYNGLIHGKGIGSTTIHVYSQSGSVIKNIPVTVKANITAASATRIDTDAESYEIVKGESKTIQTALFPAESQDILTYQSTNESVATVNAAGKVVAAEEGRALIVITASSGVTKVVPILVVNKVKKDEMNLAIHALYNDSTLKYYGTELSDVVTVKDNGEYTLELDLAEDLSKDGKEAGVTALKNLTAIYIKDYDVTKGTITSSNVASATIQYKKVVLNGNKELEILIPDSKSAMNGEVLDCGGVMNAYHSKPIVSDYSASGTVANFTLSEPVTKISITFTLSDLEWKYAGEEVVEATKLTSNVSGIILDGIGATAEVVANIEPVTCSNKISFVSANKSIVNVDVVGKTPESGVAKATIQAVGGGTTTVTAYADNGVKVEYKVSVVVPATPVPAVDAGKSPYQKGDVIESGNGKYVVTDATEMTVEYKAPTKKTAAKATVKNTIKVTKDGVTATYKVTSIGAKAFKNCKKLKSVVIGKNVKKIGANAFNGCKSLKKIQIKSASLKKVGKNAIKGIHKKAVITCSAKKVKAYKKLFKKNTGYKKSMKIKKK